MYCHNYGHFRNLYKSCMDEESIEASSLGEAAAIMEQLGGGPVVQDKWTVGWSSTIFENWHYMLSMMYIFMSPIKKNRRIWPRAQGKGFIFKNLQGP